MYQKERTSDLTVQSTVHDYVLPAVPLRGSKVSTVCALRVSYSSNSKWSFIETNCINWLGFVRTVWSVYCEVWIDCWVTCRCILCSLRLHKLFLCMCTYVCMFMYVCMYVCMFMYVCMCVYVCMYICIYVCVRVYICMYVRMCICLYVCM